MRKFLTNIWIIAMTWLVGIPVYLVSLMICLGKKIFVINRENLPLLESGMLVIYNHPDLFKIMYEVFQVPCLWAKQWILHPLKFMPWFTLDEHNFKKNPLWFWIRERAVFLRRGSKITGVNGVRKMRDILAHGGAIVHPLEPGRTCTGKNFLVSPKGNKIRVPKCSVGWLCQEIGADRLKVLLVWVGNGEIKLCPGKKLFSWPRFKRTPAIVRFARMEFPNGWEIMSSDELTQIIAQAMLKLADQE